MKIVENNKHVSMLGLAKFIAALSIVYLHCGHSQGTFSSLYLFVEFFFIITGYFTFKHFQQHKDDIANDNIDTKAHKAIKYTVNKAKSFMPYVLLAAVIRVVLGFIIGTSITTIARNFSIETLLLVSQSITDCQPIWFLSAMVIVFPLFVFVCQFKNKHLLGILAGTATMFYYPSFYGQPISDYSFAGSLFRAFLAMSCGIIVYLLVEQLRAKKLTKLQTVGLQLVELGLFASAYALMYPDLGSRAAPDYRLILMVVFVIFLTIILSGKTLTGKISSPTLNFLEKVSLVIFVMHPVVIEVVRDHFHITSTDNPTYTIIVMAGSLVASVCIFCIYEYVKAQRQKTKLASLAESKS
ncbi:MAG: acyltransferase [Candidatus Saccharibacteria bacterium]|nr:acyltransferase [Candidatus Saccharibacteria bacterium]